jgi:phage gpG-like protein
MVAAGVNRSISGGLRLDSGLTSALVPTITFEPTIGISTRNINRLGADIRSFREPLKEAVQKVIIPSIQKNFEASGRPTAWEPLSEATHEIRQRMGWVGGDILILTGKLRKTMGQLKLWQINESNAILKSLPSNVSYGGIHQAGFGGASMSNLAKKTGSMKGAFEIMLDKQKQALRSGTKIEGVGGVASIPARPFVMFQDEDEDDIAEIFVDWLDERVTKFRLRQAAAR